MRVNETPAAPETPHATEQPSSLLASGKKSRKRIYAVLGIVAVAAVASALIFAFWVPQSSGMIIPLSYNFVVGENMTYNLTANETIVGQNSVVNTTFSIDILSFDGENYTINETLIFPQLAPSQNYTITEEMNKTGYTTITHVSGGLGGVNQTYPSGYGSVGFGGFFQKDQAKVGETGQVPIDLSYFGSLGLTGNVTYKFSDIRSLTVPAGTYNVFRMDVSGSNLTASSSTAGVLLSTNMSLNCQEYFEYGTCWPIDINIQENASYQSVGQNSEMASYTMTYYFHMVLVQDIKH